MLNLFLRTLFLFVFLLFILRLTGKRQVADLEPFDLIVTLVVADVGSNAISDPNIPLLYSIVPIIGLYLIQQVIARLCLKSDRLRGVICGMPQYLIQKGVLREEAMRATNYTVHDLIDHLREKDVFGLDEVEDAILETNGSLSVRKKAASETPTREDLGIVSKDTREPQLLIRDGHLHRRGLDAIGMTEKELNALLRKKQLQPKDVFVAQLSSGGDLTVQLFERLGAKVYTFASVRKEGA